VHLVVTVFHVVQIVGASSGAFRSVRYAPTVVRALLLRESVILQLDVEVFLPKDRLETPR